MRFSSCFTHMYKISATYRGNNKTKFVPAQDNPPTLKLHESWPNPRFHQVFAGSESQSVYAYRKYRVIMVKKSENKLFLIKNSPMKMNPFGRFQVDEVLTQGTKDS